MTQASTGAANGSAPSAPATGVGGGTTAPSAGGYSAPCSGIGSAQGAYPGHYAQAPHPHASPTQGSSLGSGGQGYTPTSPPQSPATVVSSYGSNAGPGMGSAPNASPSGQGYAPTQPFNSAPTFQGQAFTPNATTSMGNAPGGAIGLAGHGYASGATYQSAATSFPGQGYAPNSPPTTGSAPSSAHYAPDPSAGEKLSFPAYDAPAPSYPDAGISALLAAPAAVSNARTSSNAIRKSKDGLKASKDGKASQDGLDAPEMAQAKTPLLAHPSFPDPSESPVSERSQLPPSPHVSRTSTFFPAGPNPAGPANPPTMYEYVFLIIDAFIEFSS
jgi:hypothetical protein